jgi:hypothetical protein
MYDSLFNFRQNNFKILLMAAVIPTVNDDDGVKYVA